MAFFTWIGLYGCVGQQPIVDADRPPAPDERPVHEAAGAFPRCVCLPSLTSAVPWLQDPFGNWFLVDTGAPRTLFTPSAAGLPPGEYRMAAEEMAELVIDAPLVVSDALPEDLLLASDDA